jgi:hypothetical protein
MPEPIEFSDQEVERIFDSLPKGSGTNRESLAFILRSWARTDLMEHLSRASLKADWKQSTTDLKEVEKLAQELAKAIKKFGKYSRTQVGKNSRIQEGNYSRARMVAVIASGDPQTIAGIAETNYLQAERDLKAGLKFLDKISRLTTTFKRGRPRNLVADLVVLDAADIYKWFTGKEASRVVHRETSKETGPFWRFLEALWPILFGEDAVGLRAAMQRWYDAREFKEKSALIANMRLHNGRKSGQ